MTCNLSKRSIEEKHLPIKNLEEGNLASEHLNYLSTLFDRLKNLKDCKYQRNNWKVSNSKPEIHLTIFKELPDIPSDDHMLDRIRLLGIPLLLAI